MSRQARRDGTQEFEEALRNAGRQTYELVLFVSGITPNSLRALRNIQRLCDERLRGRCKLTVVDLYQQPGRARMDQIIAVPTLLRKAPPPARRLIGDMRQAERILLPVDISSAT